MPAAVRSAVVVAAAVALAVGAVAARAATQQRAYHDSVGEDAAAADIASVVVSSSRGLVTFSIGVRNRPELRRDMGIQILVDVDQNPGTGNPHFLPGFGADDIISVFPAYAGLARWNARAQSFTGVAEPAFSYLENEARIAVRARELACGVGFNFAVSTAAGIVDEGGSTLDVTNAHFDFAPDRGRGSWTFRREGRPTC